ncbi:hypothetical protein E3Q13_02092 [Wallemia mellicola]|nr:hypothetical protein E3Q13_02092 [Wallemia mellicola]
MSDKIQSAIDFLNDSNTQSTSLESRLQFLQSKGLTEAEINTALASANNNRRNIYLAQQPGYQLERDWRDYFIMAVVSGGLVYGIGTLARRYLWPHLQPPTSTQYESDLEALNSKFDQAESTINELRTDTAAIKDSLVGQQEKVNETVVEIERAIELTTIQSIKSNEKRSRTEIDGVVREIADIKAQIPKLVKSQQQSQSNTLSDLQSELKSLKSLISSRQNTGATSPSSSIQIGKPQIPAWQLATANGATSPSTNSQ